MCSNKPHDIKYAHRQFISFLIIILFIKCYMHRICRFPIWYTRRWCRQKIRRTEILHTHTHTEPENENRSNMQLFYASLVEFGMCFFFSVLFFAVLCSTFFFSRLYETKRKLTCSFTTRKYLIYSTSVLFHTWCHSTFTTVHIFWVLCVSFLSRIK